MSALLRRVLVPALTALALVASPSAHAISVDDDPLASPGVLADTAVPAPPAVQAQAWLVADADTGAVLAAQNAEQQLAPASTLKILTALALGTRLDPAATYTARPDDAAIDGSKVGLVPGSVYTVDDLLHALMLGSGNDAASALADLSGGLDDAVEAMQQKAKALGASSTVVRNPSGLDDPDQVSTAHDLAVLGRAAVADPVVSQLVATKVYDFPGAGTTFDAARPHFQIGNHNKLLWNYPGALGVKNGYTNEARTSFVGAAERDGHRYVVAMMRMEGSTWRQAAGLLDWAFTYGTTATPVASLAAGEPDVAAVGGGLGDANAAAPAPGTAAVGGGQGGSEVDGGMPTWALATLVVLALLSAAVVLLRIRAVNRRRRRRERARQRALALSRTTSARRPAPSGRHRPAP